MQGDNQNFANAKTWEKVAFNLTGFGVIFMERVKKLDRWLLQFSF